MSRVRWAATLGFLTGAIGLALSIVPSISTLENSIGLKWLFLARGTVAPPKNVTIISVDGGASARAGLPALVRDWPRSTHAVLVDRLVKRGASVVAFDVEFFRHGASHEDDLEFARSMLRARRVVLVQRFTVARVDGRELWERRSPIPSLAEAAIGLAPVPVPDVPLISEFWAFLPTPGLGEVPSLPSVVLQIHAAAALSPFVNLLKRSGMLGLGELPGAVEDIRDPADLLRLMQAVRRLFRANPSAVARLVTELRGNAGEHRDALIALVDLYSRHETAYLNFFGPPGTICTLPYDRVLTLTDDDEVGCSIRDAIVFVGLARGPVARADQPDSYHTVYGSADGIDFSGVELHATALANLLTRTALRTPPSHTYFAMIVLVGACFGAIAYWARTRKRWVLRRFTARAQAAAVLTGLAAVYCGLAFLLFRNYYFVVPLVIPIAIQFPMALILGLLMPPTTYQEQVKAVCLATDAEGSTALGQRLSNAQYAALLRGYNQALARPVLIRGGAPLDPQGDGFVSVWCSASESSDEVEMMCRLQACVTAIEIARAADEFNRGQSQTNRLPARIGLTAGTVTIYSDADRGVFNVFGDAVNVAARLRDLNRDLGSRVLASEDVVRGLDTRLDIRPIVRDFGLKGIARAPVVFEVVASPVNAHDGRIAT